MARTLTTTPKKVSNSSNAESSCPASLIYSCGMSDPVSAAIVKIEDDKRLVFGWASVVKTADGKILLDRQDDYIDSDEELEKSAYDYVLHSRDGGEMHVRKGVSTLVESVVLTKEKQEALGIEPGTVPTGWWIGFKVNDEGVWDQVKKGDYMGFSVHGTGRREKTALTDLDKYTDIGKGAPDSSDVHEDSTNWVSLKRKRKRKNDKALAKFNYQQEKENMTDWLARKASFIAKFNPNHGEDGRFTSASNSSVAPAGGTGGGRGGGGSSRMSREEALAQWGRDLDAKNVRSAFNESVRERKEKTKAAAAAERKKDEAHGKRAGAWAKRDSSTVKLVRNAAKSFKEPEARRGEAGLNNEPYEIDWDRVDTVAESIAHQVKSRYHGKSGGKPSTNTPIMSDASYRKLTSEIGNQIADSIDRWNSDGYRYPATERGAWSRIADETGQDYSAIADGDLADYL